MVSAGEIAAAVEPAAARIRPHVRETPVERSGSLGEFGGAEVLLKLENLQHTGSFKVRGALNKLLSLAPDERARGVVAASTGNHGAAVAWALARVGGKGLVFVPRTASPSKLAAIQRLGMEIRRIDGDPVEAERQARDYAAREDAVYVSPYNDAEIVAGQGTIGVELERQCGEIDTLIAAVGGGGLISGIAAYLKSVRPEVEIIGCSPERSAVMLRSLEAGRLLELPSVPTLSDGTAGGVEAGALTFDLCRELIDDHLTVSEAEIAAALRDFIDRHHMLVEGAAGVALAALPLLGGRLAGRRVAVVLCGANIGSETLREVLGREAEPAA